MKKQKKIVYIFHTDMDCVCLNGLCLCHIVGTQKNLSGFVTDTTLKLSQTTCCWNTPVKTE